MSNIYEYHEKLKVINDDIALYFELKRYKDVLANMRHGIEYMISQMIIKNSPENVFDDLYSKIEVLRKKEIIDRNQASVFHNIRILANSGGSHLEYIVGEEIETAYYPYLKEVDNFLKKYGVPQQSSSTNNINKMIKSEKKETIYSVSFIYSSCRNGVSLAEKELSNREILVSGKVGTLYNDRFILNNMSDGNELFITVEIPNTSQLTIGDRVTIRGFWYPPSAASIRFGNTGTIKNVTNIE